MRQSNPNSKAKTAARVVKAKTHPVNLRRMKGYVGQSVCEPTGDTSLSLIDSLIHSISMVKREIVRPHRSIVSSMKGHLNNIPMCNGCYDMDVLHNIKFKVHDAQGLPQVGQYVKKFK